MRRRAEALLAVAAAVPLAASVLLAARQSVVAFPDAPPPANTGGFGEPTCASCHLGAAVPDSSGSLTIGGLPANYEPGSRYALSIVLVRPGMELAGFELSGRFADGSDRGSQAGGLRALNDGAAVTDQAGVQYAHHTAAGSLLDEPGRRLWRVEWTAPATESGRVVFHATGNAANGDTSPLGDHIYSLEIAIAPQP